MLKKLCIISILFLLSACSHRHYWLEVGQSYKADFSGKYELYYDIYFENKDDNSIFLEIHQFGEGNFGLVAEDFIDYVFVNNVEIDYVYTQAPFFTKGIYAFDFIDNVAKIEIEFNTSNFNKICIEDTIAVDWTDLGSFDAIAIHVE